MTSGWCLLQASCVGAGGGLPLRKGGSCQTQLRGDPFWREEEKRKGGGEGRVGEEEEAGGEGGEGEGKGERGRGRRREGPSLRQINPGGGVGVEARTLVSPWPGSLGPWVSLRAPDMLLPWAGDQERSRPAPPAPTLSLSIFT